MRTVGAFMLGLGLLIILPLAYVTAGPYVIDPSPPHRYRRLRNG
jgi:hypothetical protein